MKNTIPYKILDCDVDKIIEIITNNFKSNVCFVSNKSIITIPFNKNKVVIVVYRSFLESSKMIIIYKYSFLHKFMGHNPEIIAISIEKLLRDSLGSNFLPEIEWLSSIDNK